MATIMGFNVDTRPGTVMLLRIEKQVLQDAAHNTGHVAVNLVHQ
jgi:hypothetical protein